MQVSRLPLSLFVACCVATGPALAASNTTTSKTRLTAGSTIQLAPQPRTPEPKVRTTKRTVKGITTIRQAIIAYWPSVRGKRVKSISQSVTVTDKNGVVIRKTEHVVSFDESGKKINPENEVVPPTTPATPAPTAPTEPSAPAARFADAVFDVAGDLTLNPSKLQDLSKTTINVTGSLTMDLASEYDIDVKRGNLTITSDKLVDFSGLKVHITGTLTINAPGLKMDAESVMTLDGNLIINLPGDASPAIVPGSFTNTGGSVFSGSAGDLNVVDTFHLSQGQLSLLDQKSDITLQQKSGTTYTQMSDTKDTALSLAP